METSHNGDLDGFWQLSAIDSLANGRSCDMRDSAYFWAVQGHLLELSNKRQKIPTIYCRFELTGGFLVLSDPVYSVRLIGDSLITNAAMLRPYRLTRLKDSLRVLRLDSERMTLESEVARLYFRKY